MTEAMPFLRKIILLSYDPRPFGQGSFHNCKYSLLFCVYHSAKPNRAENR